MTDAQFPTLAAEIAKLTNRERYITALTLWESEQPLLHALGIELMRAYLAESRDLARHEADYEQDQAEALSLAAAAEYDRVAQLGMHGTTQADAERLEGVVADAHAAAERYENAQARAHDLTEMIRESLNDAAAA